MRPTTANHPLATRSRDPFQTFFDRFFGEVAPDSWPIQEALPRTNIAETDHGYEIALEMPGVEEKDIQVHLQDRTLTVTAERTDNRKTDGTKWHRVEHRYGQLARSISLPSDAAHTGVEAVFKNGVLSVTVPKAPESRPTRVQIKSA
ncbi:MAG: Hsp20/alpha crystallin family protein [Planctomycetes bacterium]|nr:Hsp20/alpha crystallin family protein [Planctomycetota bacterium]